MSTVEEHSAEQDAISAAWEVEHEVTIRLHVSASLTFVWNEEDDGPLTREKMKERVNLAQRAIDRRGEDENGIYFTISDFEDPFTGRKLEA